MHGLANVKTKHLFISNSKALHSPFEIDNNHMFMCNYTCF